MPRDTLSESSMRAIRRKGRNVALRDVAKLAQVDISTASRALNHDPRVNAERAQQIRELADRVGYRPRPLRSKLARSIGVVMCSMEHGNFVERIAWLAQRELAASRLHVNLECVPRSGPVRLPALIQQNRVDGVLLGGHPSQDLVSEIRAFGTCAVAINDSVERLKISCVRSNPEPAMRQAIIQLAARGHERFGLLMSSLEYPTIQARHHSYEASLAELGIELQPDLVVLGLTNEIAGGRAGVRKLAERGPLPTAILAENDWMAMGAMNELQRQGVRVPQDVSIIGHDDLWICQELEPQLTSIRRAEEVMVQKAIELLLEQIDSGGKTPLKEVLVEGEMVWRQSAGPTPDRIKDAAANQVA